LPHLVYSIVLDDLLWRGLRSPSAFSHL